jgi:IS30 family transposase
MDSISKPRRAHKRLSEAEWRWAVEQFELGTMSGVAIACYLGVSRQALSRGLRRRGAIQASRAHETQIELRRVIRQRQQLRMQGQAKLRSQWQQQHDALADLMQLLVAAERSGRLLELGPLMAKLAAA